MNKIKFTYDKFESVNFGFSIFYLFSQVFSIFYLFSQVECKSQCVKRSQILKLKSVKTDYFKMKIFVNIFI